jgi:hypothetical protein
MIASALGDLAQLLLEQGRLLLVPLQEAHMAQADLIELVPLSVYAKPSLGEAARGGASLQGKLAIRRYVEKGSARTPPLRVNPSGREPGRIGTISQRVCVTQTPREPVGRRRSSQIWRSSVKRAALRYVAS